MYRTSPVLYAPIFGYKQGPWKPCLWAYHSHCYTVPLERDPFPRGLTPRVLEETTEGRLVVETPGWEVTEKEKEEYDKQFHAAWPGDHLMVPFMCETCHFRKIFGREARPGSPEDEWILACMVRANLDALWARRPSTVYGNTQEMACMMKQAQMFCTSKPLSSFPRGPFPLSDGFGMLPAVMSLQQSLDKGRNLQTIQWDTMRGLRTTYSNFIHTTPDRLGGSVLSNGCKSTRITLSPANSLWFQRFMEGCHKHMGDVSIPDAALSIDTLLELEQVMDKIWVESQAVSDLEMMHKTATIGCAVYLWIFGKFTGQRAGAHTAAGIADADHPRPETSNAKTHSFGTRGEIQRTDG
ncbi:hypothetical protein ACA910_011359 [Epithemia clementina (nom. ined.)]